jgi:hypothetical protein
MSSVLTVFGTITFPAGGLAGWLDATLTASPGALEIEGVDSADEESVFDAGNDLESVRAVLADSDDCWPFMRLVIDGDALHVRAAMGDDDWWRWWRSSRPRSAGRSGRRRGDRRADQVRRTVGPSGPKDRGAIRSEGPWGHQVRRTVG